MPRMCPGATEPPGGKGAGGVPVLTGVCDLLQESSNSLRALMVKRVINLSRSALIIIYYCFLSALRSDLWIHSQEAAPNC